MYAASLEVRNTAAFTTSSVDPTRPSGTWQAMPRLGWSSASRFSREPSVSISPGLTQLTRTPCGAPSAADDQRSLGGEAQGRSPAQSSGGAGNQGHLAVEPPHPPASAASSASETDLTPP
jgi:hypothetical protein